MPGRSVRIGRIAGIPVGVSPLWLVIVALITWSLGAEYFPEAVPGVAPVAAYALGLASALLLFASILAHEFGHAIVARRRGVEVEEIDLWLLGGVSRMRGEAHTPGDELRYAVAGPAVTAAILAAAALLAVLLPASAPDAVRALVEYQLIVNALVLVFNLLPAFPLDGGRVLRAVLWRRRGDVHRATETAAVIGRGFGIALIALGGLEVLAGGPGGVWLALIGFFIVAAAGAERTAASVRAELAGTPVRALMTGPPVCVPAELAVADAAREYFASSGHSAYPVIAPDGRALGLLSLERVASLPRGRPAPGRVGELADTDPALLVAADTDAAEALGNAAFLRAGHLVVVDRDGRPLGMLALSDVQRGLRLRRAAAPAAS